MWRSVNKTKFKLQISETVDKWSTAVLIISYFRIIITSQSSVEQQQQQQHYESVLAVSHNLIEPQSHEIMIALRINISCSTFLLCFIIQMALAIRVSTFKIRRITSLLQYTITSNTANKLVADQRRSTLRNYNLWG